MPNPKAIGLLVLEEKMLMGFYHIWMWQPSWTCDQNSMKIVLLTYHKESSYEIRVQLAEWFLRKQCFNILIGLQYKQFKKMFDHGLNR